MIRFLKEHSIELTILFLTIVALALRLKNIEVPCLSWDEHYTQDLAITNTSYIVYFSFGIDANPPLYYLLAHWSSSLIGEASKFAIRLPAMLSGVLLVPAAYYLGKEYRDKILGLLCAITVTASVYPMLFYSAFARAYSSVLLTVTISTFFFIKLYRGNSDWKYKLCFAIFGTLSLWLHLFSAIPIGIFCVILLWKYRMDIFWYFTLVGLWCSPFILYFFNAHGRIGETYGASPIEILYYMPSELFGFLYPAILLLLGITIVRYRKDTLTIIFTSAFLIAYIVCFAISFFTPAFPRYLLQVSVVLTMVALLPISDYINKYTGDRKTVLVLLFVFVVASINYIATMFWTFYLDCA